MPALTRGPLPARVYWVRRMMVLGIAVLLVVGIARLLGGGSDAASGPDGAAQVAADLGPSATSSTPDLSTATQTGRKPDREPSKSREPELAEPTGTCEGQDIAVTPKVDDAVAGRPVTIVLQLRTLEAAACTWRVSPNSLTVNVTSGPDDIWSTRECRRAIPVRDVVVRKAVTTKVDVTWSSRRSDEECSRFTDWAMPGWYHVSAAALAGEPSDLQFELRRPTPATITQSAEPSESPSESPSGRPVTPSQSSSKSPSGSPSKSPSKSPSGAVEPD